MTPIDTSDAQDGGISFLEWVWSWFVFVYRRTWNLVVGVLFIPYCWILTDAIFSSLAVAHSGAGTVSFWKSHEFLMFAAGCVLWLLCFGATVWIWGEPRPLRLYVWCHEFTHAVTAKLFGGRIREFHVTREGGHIVTDRYNFLIALSPYLWPLPAVPVLAAWGVAEWFPEAIYHREWFLAALGFAWMFHVSFTCWMLPIGQSDFHGPGRVFSFAIIYLVNVLLLTLCLIVLAPEITFRGWCHDLLGSGVRFYQFVIEAVAVGWRVIVGNGI